MKAAPCTFHFLNRTPTLMKTHGIRLATPQGSNRPKAAGDHRPAKTAPSQASSAGAPARRTAAALGRFALALWLVGLLGDATATRAASTPPDFMTYQGFLVDGNGNPLATNNPANYPVIFRIYTAASGGTRLWSEQQIVTVDKGNFSVVLGEGTGVGGEARPPLSSVFSGSTASDRYLSLSVTLGGSTLEIFPRLRLLPSAYAFLATSAASLVTPAGSNAITYANNRVEVGANLITSGRVGIGTTLTPVAPLEVASGGVAVTGASGPYGGRGLYLEGQATHGSLFAYNYNTAQPMPLALNAAGGNVGVGTAAPGRKLQLGDASTPNSEALMRFASRSGAGSANRIWDVGVPETDEDLTGVGYSFVVDDTQSPGTEFTVKWGSGNVGIGTATPASRLEVRGDVRMGTNGDVFAAGGSDNLRIVRGVVRNDGTRFNGAGFTVARTSAGNYTLTFTPHFADVPAVVITPAPNAPRPCTATWDNGTPDRIQVQTWSGATAADMWFNFVAIGAR